MSKQRTHKFETKILRRTCSSLAKIISDGENNFTQNKYNKLQKISAKNKCKSANMGSSTVQLYSVDLIDIQIKNIPLILLICLLLRARMPYSGSYGVRLHGPTCFDVQYCLEIDLCVHSVNNLLCLVMKNCNNKCVSTCFNQFLYY